MSTYNLFWTIHYPPFQLNHQEVFMSFSKTFVFCFLLSVSATVFAADSSAYEEAELFKLVEDTALGQLFLHTPFLQTLVYTPPTGDAINYTGWIDGAYAVHLLSDRNFCFRQNPDGWDFETTETGGKIKKQKLTFIGRQAADDIQRELEAARIGASLRIYDFKVTVSKDSTSNVEKFSPDKEWGYRNFRNGKLILLKKDGRYIPFSADIVDGKTVWHCTYGGFRTEFDRFNDFFINQTAVILPIFK